LVTPLFAIWLALAGCGSTEGAGADTPSPSEPEDLPTPSVKVDAEPGIYLIGTIIAEHKLLSAAADWDAVGEDGCPLDPGVPDIPHSSITIKDASGTIIAAGTPTPNGLNAPAGWDLETGAANEMFCAFTIDFGVISTSTKFIWMETVTPSCCPG
jgi:hypothetical protein